MLFCGMYLAKIRTELYIYQWRGCIMPYELLEEKISKIPLQYLQEMLDFADFLIAKNSASAKAPRKSCFGAMKDKITYIAPDFNAPVADFADYM